MAERKIITDPKQDGGMKKSREEMDLIIAYLDQNRPHRLRCHLTHRYPTLAPIFQGQGRGDKSGCDLR